MHHVRKIPGLKRRVMTFQNPLRNQKEGVANSSLDDGLVSIHLHKRSLLQIASSSVFYPERPCISSLNSSCSRFTFSDSALVRMVRKRVGTVVALPHGLDALFSKTSIGPLDSQSQLQIIHSCPCILTPQGWWCVQLFGLNL